MNYNTLKLYNIWNKFADIY